MGLSPIASSILETMNPIKQWHQIVNPFEEKCHIIEIQYGDSVIEDDIERLSYYDDKKI